MQSSNVSNSSTDDLHSQGVVIEITLFIAIFSIVAILIVALNVIFLVAILKKRLLNTPSNFLLGLLCCNDLFTGLITLPLYVVGVSQRRTWPISEDGVLRLGKFFKYVFQGLSFHLLTLVSLDRYVAICHPYKYICHATRRLYAGIFSCTGLTYLLVNALAFLIYSGDTTLFRYIYTNIYTFIASSILILCSWKTYKVVKRKITDIPGITVQVLPQIRRTYRERKRAYVILLLISVHYLCFLPFYICYLMTQHIPAMSGGSDTLTNVQLWCYSCLFFNSIANPLIYYFRMANFRTAVRGIMSHT